MSRRDRGRREKKGSPLLKWVAETVLIAAAARVIRRVVRGR
ncbi:hypothetical protein [Dictyobacter aurantiacus]|nr:hypothetical protein [Dictyobacter aurantiacus]